MLSTQQFIPFFFRSLVWTNLFLLGAGSVVQAQQKTKDAVRLPLRQTTIQLEELRDSPSFLNAKDNAAAIWQQEKLVIVQFKTPPPPSTEYTIYQALGRNCYLASIANHANISRLKTAGMQAWSPLPVAAKLSESLQLDMAKQTVHRVHVLGHPALSLPAFKQALQSKGVAILSDAFGEGLLVLAEASNEQIKAISESAWCLYLTPATENAVPLNVNSANASQANQLRHAQGGYGQLMGKGVTVGIGDDADATWHPDFIGRGLNIGNAPIQYHGTHISGTVGGAGYLDEMFVGLAPEAKIISEFYTGVLLKTPLLYSTFGTTLTNNSYRIVGGGCNDIGDYDGSSAFVDNQLMNLPALMHVFAAGNDGGSTCPPYPAAFHTVKSGLQSAKNSISVGATSWFNQQIWGGSSRGPASDGRIKPEIVSLGDGVWSTIYDWGYGSGSGTSMSAPGVTGVLALMTEAYKKQYQQQPSGALLKAIVCNTAKDVGNPGPDYTYGFGWVNAKRAVDVIQQKQFGIDSIGQGESRSFTITVPAGVVSAKWMLYWHDPAALPFVSKALVNDLDITVKDPNGVIWKPLVLNGNPALVNANAQPGTDTVNNIEQVSIATPIPGNYTILIQGKSLQTTQQAFIYTYDFVQPNFQITYPLPGDNLRSFYYGSNWMTIRWEATDANSSPFSLAYSIDNGNSWQTIADSIGAAERAFVWNHPSGISTAAARFKITRKGSGQTFTTAPVKWFPSPEITVTKVCPGSLLLNWPKIANATRYEILQLDEGKIVSLGFTTDTSYLLRGLQPSIKYWLTARAYIDTAAGLRGRVTITQPDAGNCILAAFNNDIGIQQLVLPESGRQFTSSQLSANQVLGVWLRNFGSSLYAQTVNLQYQINGGAVVQQNQALTLAPGDSVRINFTTPANLSSPGTYTIKISVTAPMDSYLGNNDSTKVVAQIPNPVVPFPIITTAEATDSISFTKRVIGLPGEPRVDFTSPSTIGRLRTFVNKEVSISGNRSFTLDQLRNTGESKSINHLTLTYNLSNVPDVSAIRLSFKYRVHMQDTAANNKVWARGNDQAKWIVVHNLDQTAINNGTIVTVSGVNIGKALKDSGQTTSSSFQIRFGQEGSRAAFSALNNPGLNTEDGITIDDIELSQIADDVSIVQLLSPGTLNCGLTARTDIIAKFSNNGKNDIENLPIYYRIDQQPTYTQIIPYLPSGTEILVRFAQQADLSAQRKYRIEVGTALPSDQIPENDKLIKEFRNLSLIKQFPYLEQFEGTSQQWYTDSATATDWAWGTPAKSNLKTTASGTKAIVTRLTGNYSNQRTSVLYSPCFDISGLNNPMLSFSLWRELEPGCDCDYLAVEYSTNGETWLPLQTGSQSTNWYSNNGSKPGFYTSAPQWRVASSALPRMNGSIQLRFVFKTDDLENREGIGLDDIHVFDGPDVLTPPNPTSSGKNTSGGNWVDFDLGGKRILSIHPQNQDLGIVQVQLYPYSGATRIFNNAQYLLNRNFAIQPSVAPKQPVRIRLYFTSEEAQSFLASTNCDSCRVPADIYRIGALQYKGPAGEENGLLGDNQNGFFRYFNDSSVSIVPYHNGYYAELTVNDLGEFWMTDGYPLIPENQPVQVIQFTGNNANGDARLSLTLDPNEALKEVQFEMRGPDETSFSTITSLSPTNSRGQTNYLHLDRNRLRKPGAYTYRAKLIDKRGSIRFSNLVRLTSAIPNRFIFVVYPQVSTNGQFTINTGKQAGITNMLIRVNSNNGIEVFKILAPYKDYSLNLSNLQKGLYFLTISNPSGPEMFTQRILIQ